MNRAIVVILLAGSALTLALAPASASQASENQFQEFSVLTSNTPRARIAGIFLPARGRARGTLLGCHGIGDNKNSLVPYRWIGDRENWNLILFDFRQHGDSTHSLTQFPTLGYNEIWVVKAIVDWAEQRRLEKPYAIWGVSMGASIGLRWAAQDSRISGVLAQSPYRSAWDAVQKYQFHGVALGPIGPILLHGGVKQMLQEVDLPRAVSKRNDLLIWITCGSRDWFPESDQRAILDASPSPPTLKRLEIAPGYGHGETWAWPRNDAVIREFLTAVEQREQSHASARLVWFIAALTTVTGVALALKRVRGNGAEQD